MPCTGGLVPGDRVAALRQLLVVPKGAMGRRGGRGWKSPFFMGISWTPSGYLT